MLLKITKSKFGIVVLVLVIATTSIYFVNSYFQLRADKSDFKLVDQDVGRLTTAITAEDPKMSFDVERYCRHDTVEFGGGKLSCNITANFEPISNTEIKNFETTINTSINQVAKFVPKSSSRLDLDPNDPVTNVYTHTPTGMECIFGRSKVNQTSGDNYQIKISLSCGKYVRRVIYD